MASPVMERLYSSPFHSDFADFAVQAEINHAFIFKTLFSLLFFMIIYSTFFQITILVQVLQCY